MATENNIEEYDVLDMHNYRMEKLPVREKSRFEEILMMLGSPLAIISFLLIMFYADLQFIENFKVEALSKGAKENFDDIGILKFIKANRAMLAVFVAALILWITEAIPNYLTSLILIISLVLT